MAAGAATRPGDEDTAVTGARLGKPPAVADAAGVALLAWPVSLAVEGRSDAGAGATVGAIIAGATVGAIIAGATVGAIIAGATEGGA